MPTHRKPPRRGIVQANNRPGIPGMSARWRQRGRRRVLEIDVMWDDPKHGRRRTSYSVHAKPLEVVERAIERREAEAGVVVDLTPRQAWLRLKRMAEAKGASRSAA